MEITADTHWVRFGDRGVILDVESNRYRLIPTHMIALLAVFQGDRSRISRNGEFSGARGAIVDGLYRSGSADVESATCSALEMAETRRTTLPATGIPTATALVALRLRMQSFRGVDAWSRTFAGSHPDARADNRAIIAVAQAFHRARTRIPFARICLRDSLTLYWVLLRHGLRSRLVYGVRLDPFAAHCWVQAGDVILSDTLAAVRELRPILVR